MDGNMEYCRWEEGKIVASGQMSVGLAVLMETKLVDNRHSKTASSKTVSGHQGGVVLLWTEDDPKFEVELVLFINGPNIVTFQLATEDEQFNVIGIYIPPDCNKGDGEHGTSVRRGASQSF